MIVAYLRIIVWVLLALTGSQICVCIFLSEVFLGNYVPYCQFRGHIDMERKGDMKIGGGGWIAAVYSPH